MTLDELRAVLTKRADDCVVGMLKELWQWNGGKERTRVCRALGSVKGFRIFPEAKWPSIEPAAYRAISAGGLSKLGACIQSAFLGPRLDRTKRYYALLHVQAEEAPDGGLHVSGAAEAVAPKFDEHLNEVSAEARVEFVIWLGVIAERGYAGWRMAAASSCERASKCEPWMSGGPLEPTPANPPAAASDKVIDAVPLVDGALKQPPGPSAEGENQLDRNRLTALDRQLIDMAVQSAARQHGAPDQKRARAIVEEFIALNTKRYQSHFHRGFLAALVGEGVPGGRSAHNAERRSWELSGWLLGTCRQDAGKAYQQYRTLSQADQMALLANPTASGDAVVEFVNHLATNGLFSDIPVWVPHVPRSFLQAVLELSRQAIRDEKTREGKAIARAILEVLDTDESAPPALHAALSVGAALCDATAARQLGDFESGSGALKFAREHLSLLARIEDGPPEEHRARLEADIDGQEILTKVRVRRVEELWWPKSGADTGTWDKLSRVVDAVGAHGKKFNNASHIAVAYLSGLIALLNSKKDRTFTTLARSQVDAAVSRLRGAHQPTQSSVLLPRLRLMGALLAAEVGDSSQIGDALATLAELKVDSNELPVERLKSLLELGAAGDCPATADVVLPRLKTDLAWLASGGLLQSLLANQRLAQELCNRRHELMSRLSAPEHLEVLAALFRVTTDNRSDKEVVAELADDLLALSSNFVELSERVLQVLRQQARWTRVWQDDEFLPIQAMLALGATQAVRTETAGVIVRKAYRAFKDDPEELGQWIEWARLLGADATELERLEHLARADAKPIRDAKVSNRVLRVLFVGGDERQRKMQGEIRRLVAATARNVSVEFEHPGWCSNWKSSLENLKPQIQHSHIVVIQPFVRTLYGEHLRRMVNDAGRQWRPAIGHAPQSIARSILRAAEAVGGGG